MKWPSWEKKKVQIFNGLTAAAQTVPMAGLISNIEKETLSRQFVASLRREEYFRVIQNRGLIAANRANPHDAAFEAELGIVHLLQTGQLDEAAWLIFLMVYFAKPEDSGWTRLKQVYGRLGNGRWDWATVSAAPQQFTAWLAANWQAIGGKFGNHRKYESLRPNARRAMGPAVETYVAWVQQGGGHQQHFAGLVLEAGNDPHAIFDKFYRALPVKGFGRLGRFDWVSMLGRYGLVPASAGTAYLKGATGPAGGARLLFQNDRNGNASDAAVQMWLDQLDQHIGVGMEVMEDALCNWQKSPALFVHFKG